MIRSYQGKLPRLGEGAFVEQSAQVIGDVEIGKNSSVWFNAVVRGDVYYIRIGENTNIQDASVLHVTRDRYATLVGDYVTVGHGVILHGCTIDAHCLIGMGAIILDRVKVGQGSIVGAGAVVTQGLEIPPGSLVIGSPAKIARPLSPEEIKGIDRYAENYLMYKENYLKS
jgi:carbonic anhydrase/acetyltransferase-like protein (isoleucine patch superfamily)